MTAKPYDLTSVPYPILKLSIRLREETQFNTTLPKAFQEELAEEVNATPFPAVTDDGGLGLPPDQYCLLGVGWRLKEEREHGGVKGEKGDEKDEEDMHDRSGLKRRRNSRDENGGAKTCVRKTEK